MMQAPSENSPDRYSTLAQRSHAANHAHVGRLLLY